MQPDELISTYDLIDYCDAGIIYASKVGIEIAYAGKELIVCGNPSVKGIAEMFIKERSWEHMKY